MHGLAQGPVWEVAIDPKIDPRIAAKQRGWCGAVTRQIAKVGAGRGSTARAAALPTGRGGSRGRRPRGAVAEGGGARGRGSGEILTYISGGC